MNKLKKNNKKKQKKKHIFLKIVLFIFFMIFLIVGGFVGYSTLKNGWGVQGLIKTVVGFDEAKLADLDPFTVLILGVSEDIGVELTDTIMVASYNPKTQKATLISIPRDTYVGNNKNTATSVDKINALYQLGKKENKAAKTLAAVNKITGLNIEYYIVVSNNALVELVDTIGGVEFDVPIDMDYDDSSQDLYIHLKKGVQKLNGEQAEWLVRFRKNNNGTSYPYEYGDNDIGRMRTQREFLKVVAKQMIQVKNITKIGNYIDIFKENVTTNIDDWKLIKDYIPYMLSFNTEDIQTATIPGVSNSFGPYKLSYFDYNQKETKKLIDSLFTEQDGVVDESQESNTSVSNTTASNNTNNTTSNSTKTSNNSNVKIELLNGSGNNDTLSKVSKKLKDKGYNVSKMGTTTLTSKTAIINKSKVDEDTISSLKEILKTSNVSTSLSNSSNVSLTIIIGKDYIKQ